MDGINRHFGACVLVFFLIIIDATKCEIFVYPGLRRKPPSSVLQQQLDVPPDFLTQLIEDHARRKLNQQFEQQLEAIHHQMTHNRQHIQYENYNPLEMEEEYTYNFPQAVPKPSVNEGPIPFAVNPSDPRYYEDSILSKNQPQLQSSSSYEDDYQEKQQPLTEIVTKSRPEVTYFKAKPAISMVTPMKPVQNLPAKNVGRGRNDITTLVDKLQKEGNAEALLNARGSMDEHVVVRQHMGIEGEMGMYIVALIAGISAAVTVGLIALGVAWYTLQKKTKAAADVEYPAYGITGPNKDVSPSCDRRLAQSAQMYHYQHQKQQIIAMENRQDQNDPNGRLSDVESDDDNEEGDYTVYECPGLAPTTEMEVKNPLFLDDTPITPSSSNPSDVHLNQSPQRQALTNLEKGTGVRPITVTNDNSESTINNSNARN